MDTVEAHAMLSLQTSLRSVGSLLALRNQPLRDGQYGFCAVTHTGKGVTVQVCSRAVCCQSNNARIPTVLHASRCCCGPSLLTCVNGILHWKKCHVRQRLQHLTMQKQVWL